MHCVMRCLHVEPDTENNSHTLVSDGNRGFVETFDQRTVTHAYIHTYILAQSKQHIL